MAKDNKVTPFLMFNDRLTEAVEFYTSTFPDSKVLSVSPQSAEFIVGGQQIKAFAGGPHFKFSEGFSMFVTCQDQGEVDLYWNKLVKAGAKPSQCGWITDQFGLSWQIVPQRFMELMGDQNPKKVQAVIGAMMKMNKMIVADLEKAAAAA
ncbi:MAG: VOC family protein [Archangiaceae bacterium]|nr:VOC family protein [Archangiaceae bacterium]